MTLWLCYMLGISSQSSRHSTGVGPWISRRTWKTFAGCCWLFQSESGLRFRTDDAINVKNLPVYTHCKVDSHSCKTPNIILSGRCSSQTSALYQWLVIIRALTGRLHDAIVGPTGQTDRGYIRLVGQTCRTDRSDRPVGPTIVPCKRLVSLRLALYQNLDYKQYKARQ